MKKLISMVLAVTVLFGCSVAFALDSSTTADSLLEQLNMLSLYYDILPDVFTESYLLQTYNVYQTFLDLKSFEQINSMLTYEKYDSGIVDITKTVVKGFEDMKSIPLNAVLQWLNDEITFEECRKIVMENIKAAVTAFTKVKNADK